MSNIRTVRGTLPGLEGEYDIHVLEGDTHISKWVEEARRLDHDQNALPVIGQLIGPESVVYDVGALIGDWTAFLASKAKAVVAWEPCEVSYNCLLANMRRYPNAHCFQYAIGDGSRALISEMENTGASYLFDDRSGFVTRTLDDFKADTLDAMGLPPPNLIKLDIEGWEVRALRGAERTLREYHPTLVVEVNREALVRAGTSPEELHALLTSYGYEMSDLFTGCGWFPEDPCAQFDVICR